MREKNILNNLISNLFIVCTWSYLLCRDAAYKGVKQLASRVHIVFSVVGKTNNVAILRL